MTDHSVPPLHEAEGKLCLRLARASSSKFADKSPKDRSLCRSLLISHLLDRVVETKPELQEAVEHFLSGTPNVPPPPPDYEEEPDFSDEDSSHAYEEDVEAFEEEFTEHLDDLEGEQSGDGLASDDIPVKAMLELDLSSPTSSTASDADFPASCNMQRSDSGVNFQFDEDPSPQASPTFSIASLAISDFDEEFDLDRSSSSCSEPILISEVSARPPLRRPEQNTRSVTLSAYSRADFALYEKDDDDDDDGPQSFIRPSTTSRARLGSL